MKLNGFICMLLPQLALSNLLKRDTQTVLNDFQQISTQSQKVQSEVNAFTGDANQAVVIYGDSNTLDGYIKQAITDAQALSSLNDADSASIANAVVGLQETTYGTLDALTSKYPAFANLSSAVVGIVESSLITLRNDTAVLGSVITSKLVPVVAKVSPLLTSNIDFHFSRAVDAFANRTA